jgi:hypothetical protein
MEDHHSNPIVSVKVTSKILIGWMIMLTLALVLNLMKEDDDKGFYQIGPSKNFIFMGIQIDTMLEYILLVFCISINTFIRNLNQDVLSAWLIQNVQNSNELLHYPNRIAYQISVINGIYTWYDYIFNMKLAFVQIDMILIQIFVDMLANITITKLYLKDKKKKISIFNYNKNYQSIDIV